jgi:hypothetical protein
MTLRLEMSSMMVIVWLKMGRWMGGIPRWVDDVEVVK